MKTIRIEPLETRTRPHRYAKRCGQVARNLIELLETRIAPATFFVSSITTEVFTAAGVSAQDDTATIGDELDARDFVGVDRAVLLATGDKLVFDYNHNNAADGGEPVLVT